MFQKNNINQCSNMGITTSYLDYGENPNKRMSPYSRNINRSLKSCYIERNHAHRPCPSNLCLMDSLENYQSEADINQKKGPLGGKNQVTGNPICAIWTPKRRTRQWWFLKGISFCRGWIFRFHVKLQGVPHKIVQNPSNFYASKEVKSSGDNAAQPVIQCRNPWIFI